MITIEQIRINLIDAIRQSELTQTELAKRLGIGQQTISAYILKKAMPALDTLANMCNILDVEPNEILCFKGRAYNNAEYSSPKMEFYSKDEKALIETYRELSAGKRKALFEMLEVDTVTQKQEKHTS